MHRGFRTSFLFHYRFSLFSVSERSCLVLLWLFVLFCFGGRGWQLSLSVSTLVCLISLLLLLMALLFLMMMLLSLSTNDALTGSDDDFNKVFSFFHFISVFRSVFSSLWNKYRQYWFRCNTRTVTTKSLTWSYNAWARKHCVHWTHLESATVT